jgi:hypothetical protein
MLPSRPLRDIIASITVNRLLCIAIVFGLQQVMAADFNVTSPGSYFSTNGSSVRNPTLTVFRGETYTFSINTDSSHPFRIINAGAKILNNNISRGTITWTVPTNVVNYRYDCPIHGFSGAINTIAPPAFRIVRLDLGADLTLKFTGTNNWAITPQFATNLVNTNWLALTVKTNRVTNGTNETICGRPPGTNVFIRLRAQRN